MFCPSCGRELGLGAAYCPSCGARVTSAPARPVAPVESDFLASTLVRGSLGAARVLTVFLGGCLAFGCAGCGLGLVATGVYLIVCFAGGSAVWVPWFLRAALPVGVLEGPLVLMSGIAALVVAVILVAATVLLACALREVWRGLRSPAADADNPHE